jgi:hypothetical protein
MILNTTIGNLMPRNYLRITICLLALYLILNNANAAGPKTFAINSTVQTTQASLKNHTENKIDQRKDALQVIKYRVGVSYVNDYPMFALADLEDRGFGWSILEMFAKANNIEFEYVVMPITRLQPSMDSGAIDFIFPDNPNWSAYRSNRIPNIYSGAVLSAISATYVATENQFMMLDEVNNVAIPFGYTANSWFGPIKNFNIKSMPVRDLNTALYSIAQRTADAADVEYNIAQYLISQNTSLREVVVNANLPSKAVEYHLSSIKHIIVLEKLTTFIEKEQDSIARLRERYGIKHYHEVFGKEQKDTK